MLQNIQNIKNLYCRNNGRDSVNVIKYEINKNWIYFCSCFRNSNYQNLYLNHLDKVFESYVIFQTAPGRFYSGPAKDGLKKSQTRIVLTRAGHAFRKANSGRQGPVWPLALANTRWNLKKGCWAFYNVDKKLFTLFTRVEKM